MSVNDYVGSIDWPGAVLAAILFVFLAAALYRFVSASAIELGQLLPGSAPPTSVVVDATTGLPIDSWVCGICRSVNTPGADRCYRGCGRRQAVASDLADDLADLAAEADARPG